MKCEMSSGDKDEAHALDRTVFWMMVATGVCVAGVFVCALVVGATGYVYQPQTCKPIDGVRKNPFVF